MFFLIANVMLLLKMFLFGVWHVIFFIFNYLLLLDRLKPKPNRTKPKYNGLVWFGFFIVWFGFGLGGTKPKYNGLV